ncbi:MAG: alpha/beta fold hydrolase [Chloroflexi bacterium]|nr:alpha/beta fold hydrolase [Chloroflexota bacterium]
MRPEERYINILGLKTRFLVGGKGKPVVLIHGLGTSSLSWRENLTSIGKEYRFYALDLPGHGDSEALNGQYTLSFVARFLLDFFDSQGLGKVALAGSSMGGLLALNFALSFPERVEKLVLVDSAGLGRELAFFLRFLSIPMVGEIFDTRSKRQLRALLRRILYDHRFITEELVNELYVSRNSPAKKKAMLRTLRAGVNLWGQRREIILVHRLPELRVPTLIVWGANDCLIPVSHGMEARRLIRDSKLVVFDQCGHWPQMEKAEKFNKTVYNFLGEES